MKDVEIFCLFEYRDICFNLEEKGLPSFRDPDKKQMHGPRNNKKHFMTLPFALPFVIFQHV